MAEAFLRMQVQPGGCPVQMGYLLTEPELRELTHKQRPTAQARALRAMGIPHWRRPDGSLAVLRSAVDAPTPANARLSAPEPVLQP